MKCTTDSLSPKHLLDKHAAANCFSAAKAKGRVRPTPACCALASRPQPLGCNALALPFMMGARTLTYTPRSARPLERSLHPNRVAVRRAPRMCRAPVRVCVCAALRSLSAAPAAVAPCTTHRSCVSRPASYSGCGSPTRDARTQHNSSSSTPRSSGTHLGACACDRHPQAALAGPPALLPLLFRLRLRRVVAVVVVVTHSQVCVRFKSSATHQIATRPAKWMPTHVNAMA